jgi:hypothetical protein
MKKIHEKEEIDIALKKYIEYRNKTRLKRGERLAGPDDHFFGAELLGAKETFETRLNEESTKSSEKVSENELSGPEI